MQMLLINKEILADLTSLRTYAEAHPLSLADIQDILDNKRCPPGDTEEYSRLVPECYKIVYTISHAAIDYPEALVRTLSVSVDTPGKLPSASAVAALMHYMGFKKLLKEAIVDMEEFAPGHEAVRINEIIE